MSCVRSVWAGENVKRESMSKSKVVAKNGNTQLFLEMFANIIRISLRLLGVRRRLMTTGPSAAAWRKFVFAHKTGGAARQMFKVCCWFLTFYKTLAHVNFAQQTLSFRTLANEK